LNSFKKKKKNMDFDETLNAVRTVSVLELQEMISNGSLDARIKKTTPPEEEDNTLLCYELESDKYSVVVNYGGCKIASLTSSSSTNSVGVNAFVDTLVTNLLDTAPKRLVTLIDCGILDATSSNFLFKYADSDVLNSLLDQRLINLLINQQDADGNTLIHAVALQNGASSILLTIFNKLLNLGADATIVNNLGRTVFDDLTPELATELSDLIVAYNAKMMIVYLENILNVLLAKQDKYSTRNMVCVEMKTKLQAYINTIPDSPDKTVLQAEIVCLNKNITAINVELTKITANINQHNAAIVVLKRIL